jgi:hypothetical protein
MKNFEELKKKSNVEVDMIVDSSEARKEAQEMLASLGVEGINVIDKEPAKKRDYAKSEMIHSENIMDTVPEDATDAHSDGDDFFGTGQGTAIN